jgi:hypothetical protein
MTINNSIVGACIGSGDAVQITKTTLANNSVRYNVEFDLMPNSYNIYTWVDSCEEDLTALINLFTSAGSKIVEYGGGFALSGPKIKAIAAKDEIMLTYWGENPMLETYDNQVIVKCDKTPREVFMYEIGFYPIE